MTELSKFNWTSIYLTSLELKDYGKDLTNLILHTFYYGPSDLNRKMSVVLKQKNPVDS